MGIQCPSFVDGPGVRTVVTLAGCPLACRWCHHPASRSFAPEPVFDPSLCVSCGSCATGGPCRARARRPSYFKLASDELAARLLAYRSWWEGRDGREPGGVTFTGGEPLLHAEYLASVAWILKAAGVHVACETSLAVTVPDSVILPEGLASLASLISLWLVDLKHPDPLEYARFVGRSMDALGGNLSILEASGALVAPRVVLVPGVTDTDSAIDALAALCASRVFKSIEFIPYNPPPGAASRGLPTSGLSADGHARALDRFRAALDLVTRASR